MRRILPALGVCLLMLTAGCGAAPRARFVPARPIDRSIEKVDLDTVDGLRGGEQRSGGNPDAYVVKRGAVDYADVNGDHVEDALTSYTTSSDGNLVLERWEIYLGKGAGKVMALSRPVLNSAEDGTLVDEVTVVAGGFRLHLRLYDPNNCRACTRTDSATITVAVRGGFPVRTEPHFGAPQTCYAATLPRTVKPPRPVTPRVAPDAGAPTVDAQRVFTAAHYGLAALDRDSSRPTGWILAQFTSAGDDVCGWVRASDLGVS